MYRIMYQYERMEPEEIDTAETRSDADYLVDEYRLAYGCLVSEKSRVWKEKVHAESGIQED